MSVSDSLKRKGERLVDEGAIRDRELGLGRVKGIVEGDTDPHFPDIHISGRRFCDCSGCWWSSEDLCSHMIALIESVKIDDFKNQLWDSLEVHPSNADESYMSSLLEDDLFVKTSMETFNEIIGGDAMEGGVPLGSGLCLSGPPMAGKTILSTQLAYETIRGHPSDEPTNALALDSEGSAHTYAGWKTTFDNRYGLDVEMTKVDVVVEGTDVHINMDRNPDAENTIFVMDVRGLSDILALHGIHADVDTEGNKMSIDLKKVNDNIWESEIGNFVHQNNIGYQVYDSITNPIEGLFTHGQADRPARAKVTQMWMQRAQSLAQNMNMAQVYITHEAKNPTMQWDRPDVVGGKGLKHNVKYVINMRNTKKTEHEEMRRFKLLRHPFRQKWSDEWWMVIEDGKGYMPAP